MNNKSQEQEDWRKIDELLFSLHVRFCPFVEMPDDKIKQKDCNELKNELRNDIKYLLQKVRDDAYQEGARIQAEMDAKTAAEFRERIVDELNKMKADSLIATRDIIENNKDKKRAWANLGFNQAISEAIEIVKKIK